MINIDDLVIKDTISNESLQMNIAAQPTKDYVYLEGSPEYDLQDDNGILRGATDFAITNGCKTTLSRKTEYGKNSASVWSRSPGGLSEKGVKILHATGFVLIKKPDLKDIGICPQLRLRIDTLLKMNDFKISEVKNSRSKVVYHSFEIPEFQFVQTKVNQQLNKDLEYAYNSKELKVTGRTYKSSDIPNFGDQYVAEYEYNGEYYARVKSVYADGHASRMGDISWYKVEPIRWKILNWDNLPQTINLYGNGSHDYITVRSEDALLTMQMNDDDYEDPLGLQYSKKYLWQNSKIRAYLNGYDLYKELEKGNGNKGDMGKKNFSFENKGFLKEAFCDPAERTKSASAMKKTSPNPYGFVYDSVDNDDMLNMYIGANISVFLHGPSGVGKSSRVKQIDPTATYITLRKDMMPEEIDGVLKRDTGEYIPPLWYKQLCEKCKAEPDRKHVLFIDELTNVKPNIQSLVYSIVLDRAGKDGLWPLPDNAVVVAAGNETADSSAANPLPGALFRRFCHIYYQIDKQAWLDWATEIDTARVQIFQPFKDKNRARVHPAIVAFVMSRDKKILNQDLDEENPKIVTDPRKWKIASDVLYATRNPLSLVPAIGEDLTADFAAFAKDIQLTADDVANGNYDARAYKNIPIDIKYSTISGLVTAKESQLPVVRKFIQNNLGKELLATFDSLWIQNNPERAQIIAEAKAQDEQNAPAATKEEKPKNSKSTKAETKTETQPQMLSKDAAGKLFDSIAKDAKEEEDDGMWF